MRFYFAETLLQRCVLVLFVIFGGVSSIANASSKFDQFVDNAPESGQYYYTKGKIPFFLEQALKQNIGELEAAVPVMLVQADQNADLIELILWRKEKGAGRVLYHRFGKNITDAVLSKAFMETQPIFEILDVQEEPLSAMNWQKIKLQVWIEKGQLLNDITPIWANAESQYKAKCGTCHKQPEIAHFDSTNWIGLFNGMVGFTNMDKQTSKEVLRYLQMHASDSDSAQH